MVSVAILEVEFTSKALVPSGYFFSIFIVFLAKVTPPTIKGLSLSIYFRTVL